MDFQYKYKLTEDEHADFDVYTSWHANWQKKTRLVYLINVFIYCGISMIATIAIMSKLFPTENNNYNTLGMILILLNLLITYICYNQAPIAIKKKAIRLLRKEENHHLLDETEVTITEENIISIDNSSTTKYSWKSIVRYAVTKDFFYLYINTIQALVIPKRLLKDQREIEELDKFITEKIPLLSSFRSRVR
jgi:YcxB-like protein